MNTLEQSVIEQTKNVIEGKEAQPLIEVLVQLDRTNIIGQSSVRYLMNIGKWDLSKGSGFEPALDHLFAYYEDRPILSSKEYLEKTTALIKEFWGADILPPKYETPEPRPALVRKKTETRRRIIDRTDPDYEIHRAEGGESGSRKFKSIKQTNDIDDTDASERLQKVIKIQRNK